MPLHIASKNVRGAWAARPPGSHVVDVTSGQGKTSRYRLAFSPMHIEDGPGYLAPDGTGYACFEHWWQSLKVWADIDHARRKGWWRQQKSARRRDPLLRAIQKRNNDVRPKPLHSADPRHPGVAFGYVASRKRIYVPDYLAMIAASEPAQEALAAVRARLAKGEDVVVVDFDGPRDPDGAPVCRQVTVDLLREKIEYERDPFGHGFVVAAAVLEIPLEAYAA